MANTPATPTLSVDDIQAQQVSLSWTGDDANTDDFELQRADGVTGAAAEPGDWNTIASEIADDQGATVTYLDTTVVPGTQYTYRVRGWNRGGS